LLHIDNLCLTTKEHEDAETKTMFASCRLQGRATSLVLMVELSDFTCTTSPQGADPQISATDMPDIKIFLCVPLWFEGVCTHAFFFPAK
jgi:hypothetical protein